MREGDPTGQDQGRPTRGVDNGHTATKSKNQAHQNLGLAHPYPKFRQPSTKVLVTQNYKDSFIFDSRPSGHIHPSRADRASPQHLMSTPNTLQPDAPPACQIRHHRSPCQMRSSATHFQRKNRPIYHPGTLYFFSQYVEPATNDFYIIP